MPVAVSTGSYEVACSLDLSPVFGRIEHTETLKIEHPGAARLEERLREIGAEDGNVRRRAILDLRYFPDQGKRIVPALLAVLDEGDASLGMLVLSVLAAFPEEAARHVDRILAIAEAKGEGEDRMRVYERRSAIDLLGRVAPASERVEKALEAAAASDDESLKRRAEYALRLYRERHAPAEDVK